MGLLQLGLAGLGAVLGFSQSRKADAYNRQVATAQNEAAMMNYELALADRAAVAAQRQLQARFQAEASKAEIVRQEYEEVALRIQQGFRMQDRRTEAVEAQTQAKQAEGRARAAAGAANVSGVSPSAVIRLTEAAAARYLGASQEEERRDVAVTNLNVRDSRFATEQRLISINQPLGGIPGVAPPQLTPVPRSSSFLNLMGSLSSGLQLYASLGGQFSGESRLPSGGPSIPKT